MRENTLPLRRPRWIPARARTQSDAFARLPVGDDEMLCLLSALHARMPKKPRWTLGIIATSPGEGVSSIARGLARVAARNPQTKVLICDVLRRPTQTIDPTGTVPSVMVETVAWLPGEQVAIGSLGDPAWIQGIAADGDSARTVLGSLSASFELVILELPPASTSIAGPALCRALDAVLIVVEAERTRKPAILATCKAIERNGGNIVGMVLNKRRYHIPDAIYRKL